MVTKDYSEYIGKKFGKLTILEIFRKNGRTCAKCKCDCGNIKEVQLRNVLNEKTKSCGCLKHEKPIENLIGHKFGLLTVTNMYRKNNDTFCECNCDCGNVYVARAYDLKRGKTKSCGCYAKHIARINNLKHDLYNHRLNSVWRNMKQRCYNPNNTNYIYYGGRGITVCDEWKNDFMNFYNWAMQNGYDETALKGDCTIDRIDTNGNYEPSNCRWVDMKVQANNTRFNVIINYKDESLTMTEFTKKYNIDYDYFRNRYIHCNKSENAISKIISKFRLK